MPFDTLTRYFSVGRTRRKTTTIPIEFEIIARKYVISPVVSHPKRLKRVNLYFIATRVLFVAENFVAKPFLSASAKAESVPELIDLT